MPKRKAKPLTVKVQKEKIKKKNTDQRANTENYQQELARNNANRKERRDNDPEYAANESQRDNSTRRERRENNPESYHQELVKTNSNRQECRNNDPEYAAHESEKDNASRTERRSTRIPWEKAFETFKINVKDGPKHRCCSCEHLLFKTQITKTTREKLKKKPNIEINPKLILIGASVIDSIRKEANASKTETVSYFFIVLYKFFIIYN